MENTIEHERDDRPKEPDSSAKNEIFIGTRVSQQIYDQLAAEADKIERSISWLLRKAVDVILAK